MSDDDDTTNVEGDVLLELLAIVDLLYPQAY
jgi:hypothetical protein